MFEATILSQETIDEIYAKWGLRAPAYDLEKAYVFYTGVHAPMIDILEKTLRAAFERVGKKAGIVYTGSPQRALLTANERGDGDAIRVPDIKKIAPGITGNLLRIPESVIDVEYYVYTKGIDFPVTGWDALSGYRNGFRVGIKILEKNMSGEKTTLPDAERLFRMLSQGRLDTVTEHGMIADALIKKRPYKNILKLTPPLVKLEGFSFIHKKHRALIPEIAKALSDMKADGSFEKIKTDVLDDIAKSGKKEK